jgi:hypothetical protein
MLSTPTRKETPFHAELVERDYSAPSGYMRKAAWVLADETRAPHIGLDNDLAEAGAREGEQTKWNPGS